MTMVLKNNFENTQIKKKPFHYGELTKNKF